MTVSRKWFDRTFDLGLPDDALPRLLERLAETPDRVERLVRELPDEVLRRREADRWSIVENIGHLDDLEVLVSGRLDDFEAGLERLRPADLENRRTWEANHNARPLAEVIDGFRRSRSRNVARIQAMSRDLLERTAVHPRLGQPMRVVDLALFHVEHDEHHIARIVDLASASGAVRR
jgi:hypothetical protein